MTGKEYNRLVQDTLEYHVVRAHLIDFTPFSEMNFKIELDNGDIPTITEQQFREAYQTGYARIKARIEAEIEGMLRRNMMTPREAAQEILRIVPMVRYIMPDDSGMRSWIRLAMSGEKRNG